MLEIFKQKPFAAQSIQKAAVFEARLNDLTRFHYDHSPEYRKILSALDYSPQRHYAVTELPFLPARLFKQIELLSIGKSEIRSTLRSSGTTGQNTSMIFLDASSSVNQRRALTTIVADFIGSDRVPMLIIDSKPARVRALSARQVAGLGFSVFGKNLTYALLENGEPDWDILEAFCRSHQGQRILVFGMTAVVWEFFQKIPERGFDLGQATLIHGGGWKRLSHKAVDNGVFKGRIREICGITKVHNYYGMVEQTGSIFVECERGVFHASIFSDVLIRDEEFSIVPHGGQGLIQLNSLLPTSYPGHAILSEDLGEIIGEDDCRCGRNGKYFKVLGRMQNAELRGCSDVAAAA